MKSKLYIIFCFFFLFLLSNKTVAQLGFANEIGVFAGSVAFQSDYGENKNVASAINSGFGIGLIHFVDFSVDERGYYNNSSFFTDHFKLRTELSYSKSNFEYSGKWTEGKPSLGKQQLKAMNGSSTVTNLGLQLEFFPLSLVQFSRGIVKIAPFVSLGSQYSSYNTMALSKLGTLGTTETTFPKYLVPTDDRPHGFSSESKSVWSVTTSFGTRYKISETSDFMVEFRVQYYFSDWVDGLKPNPEIYKENQANDALVWFNVGYIYSLP